MRNSPSRVLLVSLFALLLVGGVLAPVAGAAAAASPPLVLGDQSPGTSTAGELSITAPREAVGTPTGQIESEFNPNTATRIRIEPTSDRDAQWEVSVRYALSDETEVGAFETVGERFLDGEAGPDPALFEGLAREASRNVDRTMRIESVEREVAVHEDPSGFDVAEENTVAVGELRLTFVWTAFLDTDGENLVLGDALTTPDGTWLQSLGEGQTLEIATPEGYAVTGTPGSTVQIRDNAVTIEGPRTFAEGERVVVVYAPAGAVGPPWQLLAAAIVVAALLIAGSVIGYRRRGRDGTGATTANGSGDGGRREPGADAGANSSTAASAHPEAEPGAESATESESEEDLSLLSDEERVERLLSENGGRMRQADIVTETGWSDAKVSQLLSAMADEERVEKLRLGRENLISLSDEADDGANGDDGGDDDGDGDADRDRR
ncbi:helix-turn-helix transcriptional regulator [Halorubrum sp. HHNYT27]|uniref:helix-turn-helix transcriptional regulator n=1 Tax=Halorubrum sp. HHNYT27 TaxID=3402275 RepID=UPI003EBCC542